jgi:hypothetical protein
MPPKKPTTTLAYVAKCTNCKKKHGPPLNEASLALVNTDGQLDDDDVENTEVPGEANLLQGEPAGEDGKLAQATGGPPQASTTTEDPVAMQLAHMSSSLAFLPVMYQSTRARWQNCKRS